MSSVWSIEEVVVSTKSPAGFQGDEHIQQKEHKNKNIWLYPKHFYVNRADRVPQFYSTVVGKAIAKVYTTFEVPSFGHVRDNRSCQILSVNGACPSLVICVVPTPVKTTPELSGPAFWVLPKTGDEELEERGKPG